MSALGYGILWLMVRVVGRIFFRYRTIGAEHIPKKGGVLLAANHASYADIPLLGCGVARRLTFLGRSDLFPNPVLKRMLRSLGWLPLKIDRLDRQAFGKAIELLKAGKPVVIFPEGARTPNGELQQGKPGIGVIVAGADCQVVPVYIRGTYKVLPMGSSRICLHPVVVVFGKPISFSEDMQGHQGKDFYKHVSQTVMTRIAELSHVGHPATHT